MSRVEQLQPSHLDIYGVTSPGSKRALHVLLTLLSSCPGPNGQVHVARNSCGGHMTFTSTCSRLLSVMSVSRPELKLIVTSVQAHLNRHSDSGLFMATTCLHLIKSCSDLGTPFHVFRPLYELFANMIVEYLNSPHCDICVKADFSNLRVLLAYLRSIITSKSLLNLTRTDRDMFCELVLKTFVESIPTVPTFSDGQCSNGIFLISVENRHIRESRMVKGLLIVYPELPILGGPVELHVKTLKRSDLANGSDIKEETFVKVAVITCSMSGDMEEVVDATFEGTKEQCERVENVVVGKMIDMCDDLEQCGVGLVLCQKVIHPKVKAVLRSKGILFSDRLGLQVIPYLRDVTGAHPIASVVMTNSAWKEQLGSVDSVRHVVEGSKSFLLLTNAESSVVSLILCAQWEERLSELRSCVKACFQGLLSLVKEPRLLAGGGCWQVHCSNILRDKVQSQLPTLAEKVGCSEIQVLTALKAFQSSLLHWAKCLADDTQDILSDPSSHHCWRIAKGRAVNISESELSSCCCGLKSVPTSCLLEFDYVGGYQHTTLQKIHSEHGGSKSSSVTDNDVGPVTVFDNFSAATQALSNAVFSANLVLSIGQFVTDKN